jgi:hypothetical protein
VSPILNSSYHVSEVPQERPLKKSKIKQKNAVSNFKEYFQKE